MGYKFCKYAFDLTFLPRKRYWSPVRERTLEVKHEHPAFVKFYYPWAWPVLFSWNNIVVKHKSEKKTQSIADFAQSWMQ